MKTQRRFQPQVLDRLEARMVLSAPSAALPAPIQAEIAQIAEQAARATLQLVYQRNLFGGRVHHATTVASLAATSAAVLTDFATVLYNQNGLASQNA